MQRILDTKIDAFSALHNFTDDLLGLPVPFIVFVFHLRSRPQQPVASNSGLNIFAWCSISLFDINRSAAFHETIVELVLWHRILHENTTSVQKNQTFLGALDSFFLAPHMVATDHMSCKMGSTYHLSSAVIEYHSPHQRSESIEVLFGVSITHKRRDFLRATGTYTPRFKSWCVLLVCYMLLCFGSFCFYGPWFCYAL